MAGGLALDTSGVHVTGDRVRLRHLRIERAFFGVYLREADDATVEDVRIRGVEGMAPGEQGSGIHVYDAQRFLLRSNDIADVRDGVYIRVVERRARRTHVGPPPPLRTPLHVLGRQHVRGQPGSRTGRRARR